MLILYRCSKCVVVYTDNDIELLDLLFDKNCLGSHFVTLKFSWLHTN